MRNIQTNIKVSKEEFEMISRGATLVERSKTGFILWLVKRFMRKRCAGVLSGGGDGSGQPT